MQKLILFAVTFHSSSLPSLVNVVQNSSYYISPDVPCLAAVEFISCSALISFFLPSLSHFLGFNPFEYSIMRQTVVNFTPY